MKGVNEAAGSKLWATMELMKGNSVAHKSYECGDCIFYDEEEEDFFDRNRNTVNWNEIIESSLFNTGWFIYCEPAENTYEYDKPYYKKMAHDIVISHTNDLAPEVRIDMFMNLLLGNEGINSSLINNAIVNVQHTKCFDIINDGKEVLYLDVEGRASTAIVSGFKLVHMPKEVIVTGLDRGSVGLEYILTYPTGASGLKSAKKVFLTRKELLESI